MASVDSLFAAIENRISCYSLTDKSPIPDSRIHEIVNSTVKHAPSTFNVQSARAVILLKQDHEKLWDIGDACLKAAMPEPAYLALAPRVQGFREAYGTVLFFEDQAALDTLKSKNPGIQHVIPECKCRHSTVP
jgi:predicted oxidoreductase (fatty acid repression mutant protein)